MGKRQRERARAQRKEAKQLRRDTIAAEAESLESADEAKLLNDFRLLSERHAAGGVADATYTQERQRIFDELGIEAPEDGTKPSTGR